MLHGKSSSSSSSRSSSSSSSSSLGVLQYGGGAPKQYDRLIEGRRLSHSHFLLLFESYRLCRAVVVVAFFAAQFKIMFRSKMLQTETDRDRTCFFFANKYS